MVTIGNANANLFWAGKLPPSEAIQSNELMDSRKDFITKKYIERRFANKHPLANLKPALGEVKDYNNCSDRCFVCVLEFVRLQDDGKVIFC